MYKQVWQFARLVAIYWGAAFIVFAFAQFLSNRLYGHDDKGDLHGFVNALFSALTGLLIPVPVLYAQSMSSNAAQNPVAGTAPAAAAPAPAPRGGLRPLAALVLLASVWIIAAFYCQLLADSVRETLTDPTIVGANLSKAVAEKVQTTIRGNFYLGTYFPIMAASSFLCGCLAKEKLAYSHLLLPSFITYGTMVLLSLLRRGYWAGSAAPTTGDAFLSHFKEVGLFCFVVALLAGYGWLCVKAGHSISRRLRITE